MKKTIETVLFVLTVILFFSCTKGEEKKFVLPKSDNNIVEFSNSGEKAAKFRIVVDGKDLSSQERILVFIKNMKEEYPGEALYLKAFRFVCDYTWHDDLVTTKSWAYSPYILINSFGGGLCGFRSAALTNILKSLGYKAKSWSLNGHVVTELNNGEKWILLDPDLEVYYYNSNNEIASYNEICKNLGIITNPVNPLLKSDMPGFAEAYSDKTAGLYSSIQDNEEFDTGFDSFFETSELYFYLPVGARLTMAFNKKISFGNYAFAELSLPDSFTGKIPVCLVIAGVTGNGKVKYNGVDFNIGDFVVNDIINKNDRLSSEIEIVENKGDIKIYYYVNPVVFDFKPGSEVVISGYNLEFIDLVFSERPDLKIVSPGKNDNINDRISELLTELSDSIKPDESNYNPEDFGNYFRNFLSKCERDSMLKDMFDYTILYQNCDNIILDFSRDSLLDYSALYSHDYGVRRLREFLKRGYKEEDLF